MCFSVTKLPRFLTLAVFIGLLLLGIASAPNMLNDPDTGWHLMAGRLILEQGRVTAADPFSYTTGGYPWINNAWAWDAAMAWLDNVFGLWGPVAASALIMALTAGLLVSLMLTRGATLFPAFLCMLVMMMGFAPHITVRPHGVSYFFTALWLVLLMRWQKGALCPRKLMALLPASMIFWVNIHGGFLVGFTLLGAFGAQAILKRNQRGFKTLFITGLLSFMATFINPFGWALYEMIFRTLSGSMKHIVTEWQPPGLGLADISKHFIIPLTLLLLVPIWRQLNWAERLLIPFWLVMALDSRRHISTLLIIALPAIAAFLSAKLQEKGGRIATLLRSREMAYAMRLEALRTRQAMTIAAITLVASLFMPWRAAQMPATKHPVREVAYILTHYPDAKLINEYDYGGYIIYASQGKLPVFIDGRAESAYPDAVIQEYLAFTGPKENFAEIIEKYGPQVALVPKGAQTALFSLLPGWKLAFAGPVAEVWAKE